jgi:predicted ATPase/DNA-binding CsgD family transcriptional regulator
MALERDAVAKRLAHAGITDREAEVLWAVVEWQRNDDIADRLHIGKRTVETHIGHLMQKLGVKDRTALIEAGVRMRRTAVMDATLPTPLTRLIGRQVETNELLELLGEHRLVTLVGPGGVGKTRLALLVATVGVEGWTDGTRVVDLAPVGGDLVDDAFARALGVVQEPGWSPREIMREVAAKLACLLLVDNCEHVVTEAADIVADLLSVDGRMRVLATSREPLGVSGEVSYPVPILDVPDENTAVTRAEDIADYDAVRLFVDRAAKASPGFTLTDATAPAVAALCRGLDGLPLAIELAAARVRTFGPADLLAHLDQRFELLSAGGRTAQPRHKTLRDAIDWSYNLLDNEERALFDRLGVFPADFDYQAIEAICPPEDLNGSTVMTVLPRLVDKSLVSTVERDTRRYRLLETIRDYAAHRLATSGQQPLTQQRHAIHYLTLTERVAPQLRTSEQRSWLDRLSVEQPNLHAALTHHINTGNIDAAWRAIAALECFWIVGQRGDANDWIQRSLALGDPPPTPATVAGLAAASNAIDNSDSRAAFRLATLAQQLATDLDDLSRAKAARAFGRSSIGVEPVLSRPALLQALALFGEDHPWERAETMQGLLVVSTFSGLGGSETLSEALQWGREGVLLFRSVGDQIEASATLYLMAQRCLTAGIADDQVHGWLTEVQALAEAGGNDGEIVHSAVGFATFARVCGDHRRAAEIMESCLPTLRRLGDRRCTASALLMIGDHARMNGELDRAEQLLRNSVESVTLAASGKVLAQALEALAAVYLAQGRPRSAALVLGAAHSTRDNELRRSIIQALGDSAFDDAYDNGKTLPPIEALRLTPLDGSGSSTP